MKHTIFSLKMLLLIFVAMSVIAGCDRATSMTDDIVDTAPTSDPIDILEALNTTDDLTNHVVYLQDKFEAIGSQGSIKALRDASNEFEKKADRTVHAFIVVFQFEAGVPNLLDLEQSIAVFNSFDRLESKISDLRESIPDDELRKAIGYAREQVRKVKDISDVMIYANSEDQKGLHEDLLYILMDFSAEAEAFNMAVQEYHPGPLFVDDALIDEEVFAEEIFVDEALVDEEVFAEEIFVDEVLVDEDALDEEFVD